MLDDRECGHQPDPAQMIIAVAAHRDRAAFAELFGLYAPKIKALLMRGGATAELAEDLTQEALLTVWRKAAQFDPHRASAAAWIFTIARNLRIDRLRQDNRARLYAVLQTDEPNRVEQPDDVYDGADRAERVREALAALPEEQSRVVHLSFVEGRAHGDIAKVLDLPIGTVKSRLRLAMSRLRSLLGEMS